MTKDRLVLLDEDEGYIRHFAGYFHRRERLPWQIRGASGWEELEDLCRDGRTAVLLAQEALWEDMPEERRSKIRDMTDQVLFLREKDEAGKDSVFRYQPMPLLRRRILELAGAGFTAEEGKTECTLLYAPGGCQILPECGLTLAEVMAEEKKTLMISLQAFAAPVYGEAAEGGAGLSELLYLRRSGGWKGSLENLAVQEGRAFFLPPVSSPRDIWELEDAELSELVMMVKETGEYEQMVITMDAGRNPLCLLPLCRRVLLVVEEGEAGSDLLAGFRRFLEESGNLSFSPEISDFRLPPAPEEDRSLQTGRNRCYTRLGSRFRTWLQETG